MNNLRNFLTRWVESSSRKQKWTAVLTTVGLLCTITLLTLNGGSETSRDPLGSTPLYLFGALIKLVVVLLLVVVSAIFARRWLQPGLNGNSVRRLRLVETVKLSPKQSLHLVAIDDQRLLIGATDQNVALITQLEGSFGTVPAEASVQPGPDFGSLLRSITGHLPGESSKQPVQVVNEG